MVTLAAILNSLKLVNKKIEEVTVVVNGAGSAGIACTKLMMQAGLKNVILCDKNGAIYRGMKNLTSAQEEMASKTNPANKKGTLAEVIARADVFLGVSAPGCLTTEIVKSMAKDAIIFACANPTPEIFPEDAIAGGARVIGTGRSDYPNQINNVLAFPGIFRGALDVRAKEINEEMKLAAAVAITEIVSEEELCAEYIIPSALDKRVAPAVAKAVADAAVKTGVNRI